MSVVRPPKSGLVDLAAIRRCDRAFDALAARRDVHCDDPIVDLLTALAADVDAGLPASRAPFVEPGTAEETHASPAPIRGPSGGRGRCRARLVGARAALTASVAVAALTTTGVAAAKIGTFETVERVLGISEQTAAPTASELAAAEVADALAVARRQVDQGHYAAARQNLRLAWRHWADVRGEKAAALAGAIERLESRLVRETAVSSAQSAPGGSVNHRGALPVPAPGTGPTAGSPLPETSGGAAGNYGQASEGSQDGNTKGRAGPPAGDVADDIPSAAGGGPPLSTDPLSGAVDDGVDDGSGDDNVDTDGGSDGEAPGAMSADGRVGGYDAGPKVRVNQGTLGQKDVAATADQ